MNDTVTATRLDDLPTWKETIRSGTSPVLREIDRRSNNNRFDASNPEFTQTERQRVRAEWEHLSHFQTHESSLASIRNCGVSLIHGAEDTHLTLTTNGAGRKTSGLTNLQTCGSRSCVSCNRKLNSTTARELHAALNLHLQAGGTVYYGTLTMRNRKTRTPRFYDQQYAWRKTQSYREAETVYKVARNTGTPRKQLTRMKQEAFTRWVEDNPQPNSVDGWDLNNRFDALKYGLSRVFGGGAWTKDKNAYGVDGFFYQTELRVTPVVKEDGTRDWGHTTHNLHIHYLIFVKERLSSKTEKEFADRIQKRWIGAIRKHSFTATGAGQHFCWFQSDTPEALQKISSYLTKQVMDTTTTPTGVKEHSDGSKSFDPWQALKDAMYAHDATALSWWRNYEQVMKGRKVAVWAQKLRETLGVPDFVAQQVEEEEKDTTTETIVILPPVSYSKLIARPDSILILRNITENSETPRLTVMSYLDLWGIEYFLPPDYVDDTGVFPAELSAEEQYDPLTGEVVGVYSG